MSLSDKDWLSGKNALNLDLWPAGGWTKRGKKWSPDELRFNRMSVSLNCERRGERVNLTAVKIPVSRDVDESKALLRGVVHLARCENGAGADAPYRMCKRESLKVTLHAVAFYESKHCGAFSAGEDQSIDTREIFRSSHAQRRCSKLR